MIFFTLTATTDPGSMQNTTNVPFMRLVENFDPFLLCPKCEIICTADSRHCFICNKCVERYDHHCLWVNNCIGIRNHQYFYIFIVLEFLYVFLVLIMTCFNVFLVINEEKLE